MFGQKMSTPWGQSDGIDEIRHDIIRVFTPEHGGYGVRKSTVMPPALKSCGMLRGDWRWFEEDCQAAAVIVAFPELFPDQGHVETAMHSLRNSNPTNYEKHFKVKLTAAESSSIAERENKEKYAGNFITRAGWGDWAWDVPKGFVYALGHRESDGVEQGFLVPQDEYKGYSTLVLDNYQQFTPNQSLPYTKPIAKVVAAASPIVKAVAA